MTHNTGNNTSKTDNSNDDAWADCVATHREIQRVEDTLGVAYACMDAVVIGFFTGTYTSHEVVALGRELQAWEARLRRELVTLRTAHQANVDAWLISSTKHVA